MRRNLFFAILYFSSKDEDGREQLFPSESYYVWDALTRALADHLGCKLKLPNCPVHVFEYKIWYEIKSSLMGKKGKDKFLNMMFDLLKVEWENDEIGDGEYMEEIKDFYSRINKGMSPIFSLPLYNKEKILSDFDDQTIERCKILGKLTRHYLNKHLKKRDK